MDPSLRRPIVLLAWSGTVLNLLAIAAVVVSLKLSASIPVGQAPTGDDYRNGCAAILLLISGVSLAILAAIGSAIVAIFLILHRYRREAVIAGVGMMLSLAPWILAVVGRPDAG